MSDLYYPEYRPGILRLIYNNSNIEFDVKYYYSTRGYIVMEPGKNMQNIIQFILNKQPDSIEYEFTADGDRGINSYICKYDRDDQGDWSFYNIININRIDNKVSILPSIPVNDNSIKTVAKVYTGDIDLSINYNKSCAKNIYNLLRDDPICNKITITSNEYIIAKIPIISSRITGCWYDDNGKIYENFFNEDNLDDMKIKFSIQLNNNKLSIIKYYAEIVIGNDFIYFSYDNTKNNIKLYAVIAIIFILIIAAIITPILVLKYKK